MEINWLGNKCFRITSGDAVLLTDPMDISREAFDSASSVSSVDIVIISHTTPAYEGYMELLGMPKVLEGPGEYEISSVYIRGIATPYRASEDPDHQDINTVYLIELEGIVLCHLGSLSSMPSSREVEELSGADLLFVPVGGGNTISPNEAAELTNTISPGIVIPMHYRGDESDGPLESLDAFLKEMSVKEVEQRSKLNVTKSNISGETRLIVLSRQVEMG